MANKSTTKDFKYSISTQTNFIHDCSQNANEQVCRCVLLKLQQQYSEKDYLKIDADLRKNVEHPDFMAFVSTAVIGCDAEYAVAEKESIDEKLLAAGVAATTETLSEEDAKLIAESIVKEVPKKKFVPECASAASTFYGDNLAKKVCGCAYDRMITDKDHLAQLILESGSSDDIERWGVEYMVKCSPEKFTPEMEKALVDNLNKTGVPISISKCIVRTIKKEYTVQSLVSAFSNNKESAILFFMGIASQCLAE